MYLYGASGHGRVIKEILEAEGKRVDGFVDDNMDLEEYDGLKVVHDTAAVQEMIVSIGANDTRKMIAEAQSCRFGVAIHPSAVVSPTAEIGEGTVVMAGVVINAGAKIGKHCVINTGATVDHECVLGDYSTIAPHATICGLVNIGEGTMVGAGASVINCINIGKWCVVGAGAVVVRDIEDEKKVMGVPAKEK